MGNYDFSGWATKANLKCSDGRTIMKDAFKHNDGATVPLVWNHQHNDPNEVLGHALLENREEGVYAYCTFNDTETGKTAKLLVQHGDVVALSIYANQLKQQGGYVSHGSIREVSLVLAGANPGAFIDSDSIKHGEDSDEEAVIYTGESIELFHAEEGKSEEKADVKEEKKSDEGEKSDEKTVEDVLNTLNDEQKKVFEYCVGKALESAGTDKEEKEEDSEGGNETMKQNAFEGSATQETAVLSHADQKAIVALAKQSNVGSFKMALDIFAAENEELAHGFETEALTALLPDYKNITPGAPDIIRPDQTWVMSVINKIHKSPYSRIRTRHADARIADLRAKGYKTKGEQKQLTENIKLIGRSFDPQTVYIRDDVHRDDVIDTIDFDYIAYVWKLMNDNMYETLALAALIGDGREDTDPDKIKEDHICPIWHDDELYTIHRTVDIEAARQEIQGSNTSANFSENYIYAEAIIRDALYAREKYKGTGKPDAYCDPHLVNVMLLARDLNGRRIYDSKADLARALNVGEIHEIEQFADRTRVDKEGNTKKLLCLFVNLADYQFGSTKGGEVTKFEDFDIDFNKHKFLMETRVSGGLTKLFSAIALEELVAEADAEG